jgi:hypothetical protein
MWDACFESVAQIEEGKVPGGAILAHCMGLGKTLQTITLAHTILDNPRVGVHRVLVICPVNTVKNWEDEFDKWLKGKKNTFCKTFVQTFLSSMCCEILSKSFEFFEEKFPFPCLFVYYFIKCLGLEKIFTVSNNQVLADFQFFGFTVLLLVLVLLSATTKYWQIFSFLVD